MAPFRYMNVKHSKVILRVGPGVPMARLKFLKIILAGIALSTVIVLLRINSKVTQYIGHTRLGRLNTQAVYADSSYMSHVCSDHHGSTGAGTDCNKTVHLAVVCAGAAEARETVFLLRTVLFHRRGLMTIHLITDDVAFSILETLFKTWELPDVSIAYYLTKELKVTESEDHEHLLHLTIYRLLPSDVTRVIVLEPSIRLTTDIDKLYEEFSKFTPKETIGLTKIYSEETSQSQQYSSSVVLLNTKGTTFVEFQRQLSAAVLTSWEQFHNFSKRVSNFIHEVPCGWNIRMQAKYAVGKCLRFSEPLALWWPSETKTFVNYGNMDAKFEVIEWSDVVTNMKETIMGNLVSNGDLLRNAWTRCANNKKSKTDSNTALLQGYCKQIRYNTRLKRRTHPYYYGHPVDKVDAYDVTLLTQFTMDRFDFFERMVENWSGPIAGVIHATDAEAIALLREIEVSNVFRGRNNVAIHIVYKRQRYYPINYLRNVAIKQVRTPYLVFVDVDLIPGPGIFEYLTGILAKENDPNVTYVIPAFEALTPLDKIPSSREALLELMKNNSVVGYRMMKGWNLGHKPTDYNHWKVATEPYVVQWRDAFEPYVVLRTKETPLYDERLLERMGDKIAYGLEIYARGYKFKVLDKAFIVHLPHPASEGTQTWGALQVYARCTGELFGEYKKELKQRFPGVKF